MTTQQKSLPLLAIALLFTILFVMASSQSMGQNSPAVTSTMFEFPSKFLSRLDAKAAKLNSQVTIATERSLKKLQKQEARLKKKLMKKDSAEAMRLFGDSERQYDEMLAKLNRKEFTPLEGKNYDPHLDKLQTALKFSDEGAGAKLAGGNKTLTSAREQLSGLEDKLDYTEQVKSIIQQRQTMLKDQLTKLGLGKSLLKYNKQVHYYGEQIKEYRAVLNDPGKLEQKVIGAIQELPVFKDFMQKHSAFASLFPLPGGGGGTLAPGAQTLDQVEQLIQSRVGGSGPAGGQFMQQQLQGAQTAMSGVQDKIIKKLDGGGETGEMDFKPNDQKTKPIKKRIELGSNLQTVKSNNFFPSTTDVGLSLGYKLHTSGVIGIGASYKVGWGKSINHIRISHEGIGLRSFVDWKLKGNFFLSGGYEQNYRASFRSIAELKGMSEWQQSGLIGVSKIVSMKTKLFKKTKAQLFWDMLSYQQLPREQPIKFRLGYTF